MAFLITSIGTIVVATLGWLAVQHRLRERRAVSGGSRAIEVAVFLGVFGVLVPVVFYLGLPQRLAGLLEYLARPRVEPPDAKIAASPTGTVEERHGQSRYVVRLPERVREETRERAAVRKGEKKPPELTPAGLGTSGAVPAAAALPPATWSANTSTDTYELNGKRQVIALSSVILKPGQKSAALKYRGPAWEENEQVRFTRGWCLRSFKEARFTSVLDGKSVTSQTSAYRAFPEPPGPPGAPMNDYAIVVEAPVDTALPEVAVEFVYYREWKPDIYEQEFKAGIPPWPARATKVAEQIVPATTDDWVVSKVMLGPGEHLYLGPFESLADCARVRVGLSGGQAVPAEAVEGPTDGRLYGYLPPWPGAWGPYAVWVKLEHGPLLPVWVGKRKPFEEPSAAQALQRQIATARADRWTITRVFAAPGQPVYFGYTYWPDEPRLRVSVGGSRMIPLKWARDLATNSDHAEFSLPPEVAGPSAVWIKLTGGAPLQVPLGTVPPWDKSVPVQDTPVRGSSGLEFDGSDTVAAVLANSPASPTGGFTLSCWVWHEEAGSVLLREPKAMVLAIGQKGQERVFEVWVKFFGNVGEPNARVKVEATPALPVKAWVHLACTWDTKTLKLYVNGRLGATRAEARDLGGTTQQVRLGRFTSHLGSFRGKLDELALYNRALSDDEIRETMNRHLTGQEPGLVGYYNFDEGQGTTVADRSGHGNHGECVDSGGGVPTWIDGKEFAPVEPPGESPSGPAEAGSSAPVKAAPAKPDSKVKPKPAPKLRGGGT